MVSVGNESKFATSEICQKCGNCCKTFSWTDSTDQAIRFMWMGDKDITAEDTPFKYPDGEDIKVITIKRRCKMLGFSKGKYFCRAYNKERPDFCNTYPDHIFFGIEEWNRDKIQKAINYEKRHCPLFRGMTVDDVISKLYKPKETKPIPKKV